MTSSRPAAKSFSVAICCYTEARLQQTLDAVASVKGQSLAPLETILVVDHNPGLFERILPLVTGVRVLPNVHERGLSGARNSAIEAAEGEVLAFLDDDAEAAPDWLAEQQRWYEDPGVLGVGGYVEAEWGPLGRPKSFPPEFDWVVGCSYVGLPSVATTIRNPIGANMSIRASVFKVVGGFRSTIGRVGTRPVGCEETELCIRARQILGGRFVYEPAARVLHHVDERRRSMSYFMSRCYSEGISKALVVQLVGAADGLRAERAHVGRVLTRSFVRNVEQALTGGGTAAAARATRIGLGTAAAAIGYALQRVSPVRARMIARATRFGWTLQTRRAVTNARYHHRS